MNKKFRIPFSPFSEEKYLQKVREKMDDKPFSVRYRKLKKMAVILSYLFAIVSAIGLIMLVFFKSKLIFQNFWLAVAIAAVFAYYFEKLKRMSSTEFYEYLFFKQRVHAGWLTLTIVIFIGSLLSSPLGLRKTNNELSAPADILAYNQQSKDYEAKVKSLNAANQKLSENKNSSGEIYWPSQKSIEKNTATISKYEDEIRRLNKITEEHNAVLTTEHREEVYMTGNAIMGLTALFEFLFECCMGFIFYYYARVDWERRNGIDTTLPSTYANTLDGDMMLENNVPDNYAILLEQMEQMRIEFTQKFAEQKATEQKLRNKISKTEQRASSTEQALRNKMVAMEQNLAERAAEQKRLKKKWKAKRTEKPNVLNGHTTVSPN